MGSGGRHRAAGIIPACAGSSDVDAHNLLLEWDHPRVCGEQAASSVFQPIKSGSSPRVRGAVYIHQESY